MAIDPHHTGEPVARPGRLARLRVDTRPLRHRDYRHLWVGQAISTVGGEIGVVAVVGYLYAAPSAGALLGSLASGWTGHVRRQGLAVTVAACLWGASIAAFGFATSLWPALALLAVAGCADFFSAVLRGTMLQRSTPDHMLGRLSGIEWAQVAGAPNLGDVEAGVLASLTSLRFSIVSGGVACVVACAAAALALPAFLRYDARNPAA